MELLQVHSKDFEISEYVLPKFEVKLDVPSFIVHKDKTLKVTVRAKYTFGKPVKGEVELTATKVKKLLRHSRKVFFKIFTATS